MFVCTGIGTILLYSIKLYYSGTSDKINAYSTRLALLCVVLCCCFFFFFFFCVAVTNLTRVCMWYFSMCFISNKLYHAHFYVYARSNTLFNSSRKSDLFFFAVALSLLLWKHDLISMFFYVSFRINIGRFSIVSFTFSRLNIFQTIAIRIKKIRVNVVVTSTKVRHWLSVICKRRIMICFQKEKEWTI